MASEDIALMAHLMRRAGFGASREELEARAAKGYEATVEELLNPKPNPLTGMSSCVTSPASGSPSPPLAWGWPRGFIPC